MPPQASTNKPARVQKKKMRKGTKSCLPCRRRKIRCSGFRPDAQSCIECISRGTPDCAPQGEANELNDAGEIQRLRERVAHLETELEQFGSTFSVERNAGLQILPPSQKPSICEPDRRPHPVHPADAVEHEEEVETGYAPLVSLLNPDGAEERSTKTGQRRSRSRREQTARALREHVPSQEELEEIIDKDASWWQLYRDALGLVWTDSPDMSTFVSRSLSDDDPAVTALLLVCLALSTGEYQKYLPPVEEHVVNCDQYAATEHGLNALMALGLCYMNALRPCRAWAVYRRANTLLQLSGCTLHWRKRRKGQEAIFWQLFHADRWVSLMIGLPYTVPDHFCDLTIAPLAALGPATWLYRQLCVVSGRIIDLLQRQDTRGPMLSSALAIEERISEIIAELPADYLDMDQVRACSDSSDKGTRLYRVVHVHLLRIYVHLPFFFRSEKEAQFASSRQRCIDESRELLVAYLEIFDTDHRMAANGTVLNLTAFTAAAVVLLGLTDHGCACQKHHHASESQPYRQEHDLDLIIRTRDTIKCAAESKIAGRLSAKCYEALNALMSSAQSSDVNPHHIVLPYFGTVTITNRMSPGVEPSDAQRTDDQDRDPGSMPAAHRAETQPAMQPRTMDTDMGTACPDIASMPWRQDLSWGTSFTYSGPFMPGSGDSFESGDASALESFGDFGWTHGLGSDIDWNWLYTDLPPDAG